MHGNGDAFAAVRHSVRRKHFDATLVLGDLVGYGASPDQVVEAIPELPGRVYTVRGNHDKVAAGIDDGATFNAAALAAARWTADRMKPRNLKFVHDLPVGPMVIEDGDPPRLAICHGSPADEDTYLFAEQEAWAGFNAPPGAHVTFFGHTHLPSIFILHRGGVRAVLLRGKKGRLRIHPSLRYLINPGSVGQPRDRNPLASYMMFDSESQVVTWKRIRYPVRKAQRRIEKAGLPKSLAERLQYGM